MKVFMLIVAAMALAPRLSAAAECTLPTPLAFGSATGAATGCVAGEKLAAGVSCNLKLADGYTGDSTGTYTCHASLGTLTTSMAATGCAVHYYHSAGTSADALECTFCPIGKTKAAKSGFVLDAAPECDACLPATAGSCATGCPADHSQNEAATTDLVECTKCADKTTKAATRAGTAATTCDATVTTTATTNSTAAAAAAAAAGVGVGAAASSAAVAVLLASFY